MQTVNFQCGHCGNLMAVTVENLGRQVRCPTCQQVVVAPAAAPAPEVPVPAAESENTLAPPVTSDARLNEPEQPRLEVPPPPAEDAPAEDTLPITGMARRGARDNGMGTIPWQPPEESPPPPAPPEPPEPMVKRVAPPRRVNLVLPLLVVPLILYAVAATAVAAYIYSRWQTAQPSLFDQMPDVDGDTPGVRKEKKRVRLNVTRELALRPLPPHLLVKLGETIQVGDLKVTPKRVQRRKVAMFADGATEKAEPSPHDALVLTLALKNTSPEYAFTPLDNYFDRNYKPGNDEPMPLTVLQAGSEAFFGGPAKWSPRGRAPGRRHVREWLEGRKDVDPVGLLPGESLETIVATDAWSVPVAAHLFGDAKKKAYQGKLLWRVHLRRGTIEWRGREVSAAAVVGVEFDDAAYRGG